MVFFNMVTPCSALTPPLQQQHAHHRSGDMLSMSAPGAFDRLYSHLHSHTTACASRCGYEPLGVHLGGSLDEGLDGIQLLLAECLREPCRAGVLRGGPSAVISAGSFVVGSSRLRSVI